jgi:hypothetical protein
MNMRAELNNKTCRVCGDHDLRKTTYKCDSNEGSYYIERVIKNLEISKEDFIKLCNVYICSNCYCYSIHPWITNTESNIQFTYNINTHNAGWAQFEDSLVKNAANYYLTNLQEALKNILNSDVKKYAEVGCPFNGAFVLENYNKQKLIRKRYISRLSDKSTSTVSSLYYLSTIPVKYLNKLFTQFRFYYHKNKTEKVDFINLDNIKKYLIRIDTNLGWTYNCVKYDATCLGYAAEIMEVEPIGLSIALDQKLEFDVIGVYNYLDHCDNPLRVLNKLLLLTNKILICTHNEESAGYQHSFAFSDEFFEIFLKEKLKKKYFVKKMKPILNNGKLTDNIYEITRLDSKG